MDTTITTGWWTCPGCGVEAELPVPVMTNWEVPCPDCGAPMIEQWRWDAAA
jgi:hypothetical protein